MAFFLDLLQEPSVLVTIFVVLGTSIIVGFLVARSHGSNRRPVALDPENYVALKLAERRELSHDTRLFRFSLQTPLHILGLPIGQHISMRFVDADSKPVSRSYTPTSSDEDIGHVDFVVKVYPPNTHPNFPAGGKMSFYLENLKIGQYMDMRGPKGNLQYMGDGLFNIKRRGDRLVKKVGMIAGGTGITPMLQIINAILREASGVEISLLFANQAEEDILLRDVIESLEVKHPNFKFWYTLDRPPGAWKYSTGFVSIEMIESHLPAPGKDTLILMCGPPPMLKFACIPSLEKLGYTEEMHFSF